MSDYDISAANSVFTITVPGLYNAPITLENYAADRAFETEARELIETQMSIDGYLNAGWVPNPVTQSISLAASSDSAAIFEVIVAAQDAKRGLYRLGAEIQLPSIGRKYTMVRGLLRSIVSVPSPGRVLEARTFEIIWERVIPAAI
ncbi:phage tail fiber protein [Acetobacter pasteurianus]